MKQKQPMQPMYEAKDGRMRFQSNAIVDTLLEYAGRGEKLDLNGIAWLKFSQDDRCQFAQLIGYSLEGYHELSYVSDNHAKAATQAARKIKKFAKGCRDIGCHIHKGVKEE